MLLDNQSTLHIFCNPDHHWISNIRSGPDVINIHCNAVIANTKTISDVAGLYGDTAWIHPSEVTNVLSLSMIEKRFRITYDNHGSGGNAFIIHISPGHDIRFRQYKRGLYYYDPTDYTSRLVTLMVNTASPRMLPATAPLQELVLVQTVEGHKELFTRRGVKVAIAARYLQQTMLSPGKHKMEHIAHDGLIQDSPVTTENLTYANHIYVPDVLGLKGKGTKRKIPTISIDIVKVQPSISSLYCNLTACGDVFFVNKIAFFGAIVLNIRYGYDDCFLNRHIPTFLKAIKHMCSRYALRGFLLRVIKLNP